MSTNKEGISLLPSTSFLFELTILFVRVSKPTYPTKSNISKSHLPTYSCTAGVKKLVGVGVEIQLLNVIRWREIMWNDRTWGDSMASTFCAFQLLPASPSAPHPHRSYSAVTIRQIYTRFPTHQLKLGGGLNGGEFFSDTAEKNAGFRCLDPPPYSLW